MAVGEGRFAVRLDLLPQGKDWLLVISGGAAHVGAVALAAARDGGGVDTRVAAAGRHREGPLAEECAAMIAQATGRTCAVVAGIHQDEATPEEIAQIVANVRQGAGILAARVAGPSRDRCLDHDPDPDPGRLERQMEEWSREAAAVAMACYRNCGPLRFKHGQEAVTDADARIERLLRARITQAYPGDAVSGEELGSDPGGDPDGDPGSDPGCPGPLTGPDGRPGCDDGPSSRERRWHLDPIDGTLNFALGMPGFCISLALLRGQEPLAACVMQPPTGDLFTAIRGQGARLNGAAIAVSGRGRLDQAVVSTQLKNGGRIVQDAFLLQALLRRCMKTRRVGAIALELAWVAAGGCDALVASFEAGIELYDVAAGMLLVTEAGGRITDLQGRPYRQGGPEMLASNALVHEELLDLLRRS